MTNLLLRDLALCNLGICLLSTVLYLAGHSLINAISISCLVFFALLLIWGGALGFFISSASFDFLSGLMRRGRKEEEAGDNLTQRGKVKEEQRAEIINAGKRMIILSLILLGELLLFTLAYLML